MIYRNKVRWALSIGLALGILIPPILYYRMAYTYQKRLRVVTPGRFYRSGSMSATGLAEAIQSFGIRTVINLMNEAPDPLLNSHYFAPASVLESELVARNGAKYVTLALDIVPKHKEGREGPAVLAEYLKILDDPAAYPVLIHCKAGLHRTGVMVAVYRMEFEGWSTERAIAELRRNGFGEFTSTSANAYIQQYVLTYQPRQQSGRTAVRATTLPAQPVSRPTVPASSPKD